MVSAFLKDFGIQTILHSILGIVIYFLTKHLTFTDVQKDNQNSKSSALWAIGAVSLTYLLIALLFSGGGSGQGSNSLSYQRFNFNSVQSVLLSYLFILSPSLVIIKIRKENLRTVGISKLNVRNAILVGLITSVVALICLIPFADKEFSYYISKVNINLFWGFIYYAVVGFGEEFLFRGYLQSRLIAWIGSLEGWIIASIIMALIHVPQRIAMHGMFNTEALLSSIALIPVSLLHGYIMMKTKNLVAPGILHTFANWYNIIFS